MSYIKKCFAVCLSASVLLSLLPLNVNAATQIRLIRSYKTYFLSGRQITTNVTAKFVPVSASQALHKKGYTTTIGVSSSKSNSVSATTNLTVGVDAIFGSMSASMGVGSSATYTTGSSISYTISSSTRTGRYRIEHVFPGMKVQQQKFTKDKKSGREKIKWSRTVSYAPRPRDAYRRLARYADK